MVWYFHESGRKPYGTDTSWERHDQASAGAALSMVAASNFHPMLSGIVLVHSKHANDRGRPNLPFCIFDTS